MKPNLHLRKLIVPALKVHAQLGEAYVAGGPAAVEDKALELSKAGEVHDVTISRTDEPHKPVTVTLRPGEKPKGKKSTVVVPALPWKKAKK
jgi:hypothetical protein